MRHLLLILLNFVTAAALTAQSDIFVIDKIEQDVLLNDFLLVQEMDSADPDLADIQSQEWQERFVPYQDFVQKYLPAAATGKVLLDPSKVYWWRLTIRNELDQPINDWVLHTGRSNFTEVFMVGGNGQLIDTKYTGWLMPTAKKDYLIGNRQAERVPFSLAEGASVTVYGKMRVVNEKEPFIWVQLSKEDYFKNWQFIEKTRVEWASIGSLLTFILFSILLYFTTRDRVFLWHSLYLSGIFLYLLEFFNVLPDMVWMPGTGTEPGAAPPQTHGPHW